MQPSGDLQRVATGESYPAETLSYFLHPQPGVFLADRHRGPQRIAIDDIEGLTTQDVIAKIGEARFVQGTGNQNSSYTSRRDPVSGFGAQFPAAAESPIGPTLRLPPVIAAVGTNPLSTQDISSMVHKRGSRVVEPGDPSAEFLVIGADGWLIDDIEDQIRVRSGHHLYIFSQEMFRDALATGQNPFDPFDRRTLDRYKDHPALKCCQEEGFNWVNLDTAAATVFFDAEFEQATESPLHALGYRVGRSSALTTGQRHNFLTSCFLLKLPPVHTEKYMLRWGAPGTRRRLRRMSHALSWYVRGAQGRQRERGHDMSSAVQDWIDDLAWLRTTHYQPWMRFRWPDIDVPDK